MPLNPYAALLLLNVGLSCVSQLLLKLSASKRYPSRLREYLNGYVLTAYSLFVLCTGLGMIGLRGVSLKLLPALEASSFLWVLVLGRFFLKEEITWQKIAGNALIALGIFVYLLR